MTTKPLPKPSDTPSRVREAVAAALDKKAIDLRVLYLGAISDFTDYFVLASGSSERQVQAIADGIEERLREQGLRPLSAEGYPRGQWVLLDYGSFLVHVFTEERRAFYRLERLWSDAPDSTKELGG
jgi:ribosome-associated protein